VNAWKADKVSITIKKKMVGESSGSVTWRNCSQKPAPSMRAASYNSSGIPCMPASMMIVFSPSASQMVTMETEKSAHTGSVSQGTRGRYSRSRI